MSKRKTPTRKLAEEIARHLFTAYGGTSHPVHADQIWLYKNGREVAGWAESCMADVIEDHLKKQAANRPRG